jgi:cytochrome c2
MRIWKRIALFLLALPIVAVAARPPAKNGQKGTPAAGSEAVEIEKGKTIYAKRCAVCHFAASDAKKVGPGLKGLSKRRTFTDRKPVTDESLRAWIETGGKDMPGFRAILNANQVRDLIVYLKSL